MALIPSFFSGRRSNMFDPFSSDVRDPFKDFPLPNSLYAYFLEFSQENSTFLSTQVDWKETPKAHMFKADIAGLMKEEVKVEIEDDKVKAEMVEGGEACAAHNGEEGRQDTMVGEVEGALLVAGAGVGDGFTGGVMIVESETVAKAKKKEEELA
ncbi:18.5 kDa class I heat shock protein [Spatholobus suberectus]|nr:18.5 kDa class I heat shock protein [Spatholobus suberectus]